MSDKPLNIALNNDHLEALARISKAEAGNQGPRGQAAVIRTVLNRQASGRFAKDVFGVIEQHNQFEPMNGKRSWRDLPGVSTEYLQRTRALVEAMASGQLGDMTNGSTFFQNDVITNKRGTNFARNPAVARIGDHGFWRNYKGGADVAVPDYTLQLNLSGESPNEEVSRNLLAQASFERGPSGSATIANGDSTRLSIANAASHLRPNPHAPDVNSADDDDPFFLYGPKADEYRSPFDRDQHKDQKAPISPSAPPADTPTMPTERDLATPFDPEGDGYDYKTALAHGLGPDATGHWPSRVPETGQLLKGRRHETWHELETGEAANGYTINLGPDGKYYSVPTAKFDTAGLASLIEQTAPQRTSAPATPFSAALSTTAPTNPANPFSSILERLFNQ